MARGERAQAGQEASHRVGIRRQRGDSGLDVSRECTVPHDRLVKCGQLSLPEGYSSGDYLITIISTGSFGENRMD